MFSITAANPDDVAEARVLREAGYVPLSNNKFKPTRLIAKSEIKGSQTVDPGVSYSQEPVNPEPRAQYSRSSTITERIVTDLVARETARKLGVPFYIPQMCTKISEGDKIRVLDPSAPMTPELELATFAYLNGQGEEFQQMPSFANLADYVDSEGIANMIVDTLSMGYDHPHIPVDTLCIPMMRDSAGMITPIASPPREGPAIPASPNPSEKSISGDRVNVPVVFVRTFRIAKIPGIQMIPCDHYEPWLFMIIGDVIFAPFDSDMCNISFVHKYTRKYALLHGVKHVRVVITLDLRTMTVDARSYW